MKILFAKTEFAGPISGADEIVATYAIELKKAGHETAVLLIHSPTGAVAQTARLEAAGVEISVLASPTLSSTLAFGRRVVLRLMDTISPASKLIRTFARRVLFNLLQRYHDACCKFLLSNRPEVVHVVAPDSGAVMLIRAAHAVGIPVVYHEVGMPFEPPGFEDVYERLASVLFMCTEVAALSPRIADAMLRMLPDLKQLRVLPLISQNGPSSLSQARAQSNETCFGFAARLEHLKGPLPFVEAFALARSCQPCMSFKMAGDGSQRGLVLDMIEKFHLDNSCQLVGTYKTASERSSFMQSIDVFVLPSLTEGTPNSIIEAMAHGKPVIATDVGGIPDMVTRDVGILIPAGDNRALGTAMALLAANPELRERMGGAARQKYEQLFTPGAVLPVITEFYKNVARNGKLASYAGNSQSRGLGYPWVLTAEQAKPCEG